MRPLFFLLLCAGALQFTCALVVLKCNSSAVVCERVSELLQQVNVTNTSNSSLAPTLVVSIGETTAASSIFTDADRTQLAALGSEGFIMKSAPLQRHEGEGGVEGGVQVGVLGNAWETAPASIASGSGAFSFGGVVFGAYAVLSRLGFAFLHPLRPSLPARAISPNLSYFLPFGIIEAAAPRWPVRGFSHHTQHTLELVYVLNGVGAEPQGLYADEAAFEAGLPMVARWAEWLVARRQNRAQWILLELPGSRNGGGTPSSPTAFNFTWSPVRQKRLTRLVEIFHGFGVAVGVDVPLVFTQENSMNLANPNAPGNISVDTQIAASTGWLADAGFDFVASESGFSEFTHGSDTDMLRYLNQAARHLRSRSREFFVKVHISSGQFCSNFTDPRTGKPLDFNFLPMLAEAAVNVYPHTVQFYGLHDPVANSYGRKNFTFMEDWMFYEAHQQRQQQLAPTLPQRRKIVYKPETAYWGNFDNTVPLFLPLYALKRVEDLHRIAKREAAESVRLDGQVVFSSGWEWGYWLSDVVAADAAWNPRSELNEVDAVSAIIEDAIRPLLLAELLQAAVPAPAPVLAADAKLVGDWITRIALLQNSTLIYGEDRPGHRPVCNGGHNASVPAKLTGIAYLEGWDAISDVERLSADLAGQRVPNTQPSKLDFAAVRLLGPLLYKCSLRPLLQAMSDGFAAALGKLPDPVQRACASKGDSGGVAELFGELVDALNATSLRASFVLQLNDFVAAPNGSAGATMARISAARSLIDRMADLVARREVQYRVPSSLLGGWGANPTSYRFGYLWNVHSQYYFWRDLYKASAEHPDVSPWPLPPHVKSPCFINVQDPVSTQFGGGGLLSFAHFIHRYLEKHHDDPAGLVDCLSFPDQEPRFPL